MPEATDGGPAFPVAGSSYFGMSKRFYVAVEAMKTILMNPVAVASLVAETNAENGNLADVVADLAFQYADAMLKFQSEGR